MAYEDIIWRMLDRLQESERMVEDIIEQLHPEKDKTVMDAFIELEQLTTAQINVCRRLQRRLRR